MGNSKNIDILPKEWSTAESFTEVNQTERWRKTSTELDVMEILYHYAAGG